MKIIVGLDVQSEIMIPNRKICWKNMSQKIIHIFRMSRVWFWHQRRKFAGKTCHRKSSIFSGCPECDFDNKEETLLKKHVTENQQYFQNVQSVILTPKKKIYWKIISQKIIHCHLYFWNFLSLIPKKKIHVRTASKKELTFAKNMYNSCNCTCAIMLN